MVLMWAIWCPLGDECKKGNKMVAKARSEKEVRDRLLAHLYGAPPHHDLSEEERKDWTARAETKTWEEEWEEEKEQEQEAAEPEEQEEEVAEPEPKRFKGKDKGKGKSKEKSKGKGSGKGKDKGAIGKGPVVMPAQAAIANAVASGVQQALALLPSGQGQGQGQEQGQWQGQEQGQGQGQGQRHDKVLISRARLQECADHLGRAEAAARQAARISSAAANAFEQEANNLQSVRISIEGVARMP